MWVTKNSKFTEISDLVKQTVHQKVMLQNIGFQLFIIQDILKYLYFNIATEFNQVYTCTFQRNCSWITLLKIKYNKKYSNLKDLTISSTSMAKIWHHSVARMLVGQPFFENSWARGPWFVLITEININECHWVNTCVTVSQYIGSVVRVLAWYARSTEFEFGWVSLSLVET